MIKVVLPISSPAAASRVAVEQNTVRRIRNYLVSLCSSALLLSLLVGPLYAENWNPGLYVFQNGLELKSYENEAEILKELGYQGATSVKGGGSQLAKRIEIFHQHGLRVPSLYKHLKEEAISAETIQPLGQDGGMLELMVKELNPTVLAALKETVETAAALNVRVVLYPHFGCDIDTVASALKLIKEVDHPNLGTAFNLCHFLVREDPETLEAVIEEALPWLWAVSTSGANLDGEKTTDFILRLDQGDFPQKRLFRHLKKLGYQGPVGLQCYRIPGDKVENLKKSIEAWNQIIKNVNS